MSSTGVPIKVLLDCRMATWSGVGRYTRGLTKALLANPDIAPTLVIGASDQPIAAPDSGVKMVRAGRSPLSLGGMFELTDIAEHERPDLIHCLHFPTPWRVQYPMVVTLHDITPLMVPGVMPSAVKRMVYREMNRRAVKNAARVIAPSTATARDILRVFPSAAGKTDAIVEAADDFSAGDVGELPQTLGLAPGDRYILTMGNTKAHKDLPTLIDAFLRLSPTRPDVRLVLVGDEPRGYLDARLSGMPRKRAMFTGPVSDDQLRALYANATMFAFPSLYEGFGLPPLEAMAFGAPVIAADAASLPEVVGDAGVLFRPGDSRALLAAMARLLDNSSERDRLKRAGKARAAAFTWATTASQTVEVYKEALGLGA